MSAINMTYTSGVTFRRVEEAHKWAKIMQQADRMSVAEKGMRAARSRDASMLVALEKAAEVMDAEEERQRGVEKRTSKARVMRSDTVETQLWREAYRAMDEGRPLVQLAWIYGAAGRLAGLW